MKALKEFDYNLWTTEENGVKKYFVGVKATGEVTEVDAEVMKVLRNEETEPKPQEGESTSQPKSKESGADVYKTPDGRVYIADCLFELFETRTIKGNAAVTVINKRLADNFQIVVLGDEVFADSPLTCDGVAFNLVSILTGQPAVDRRSVNLFWHKNNLRVSVWCDTSNQKDEGCASVMTETG